MSARHTKAPWEKRVTGSYVGIVAPSPSEDAPHGQLIAKMVSGNRRIHEDADVIAAAPELLSALEACAQVLAVQYQTRIRNGGAGQQAYDKARAAIAKARAPQHDPR